MVQGCTSDAGKSFLVAALCRALSNRGENVAPFKAQNMSNHAAVTRDGLEIGRAQYLQALAARAEPTARMNPVLLKPSADTHSHVVLLGKPAPEFADIHWHARKEKLWPVVSEALHGLMRDHERVVIEGAGSPAEVNLRASDIVNMSVALEARADVYLIADIDRGGAFAHLLGTWMCLAEDERDLVKGFVLNKFRGDEKLLGSAPKWLEERTGVPLAAVVPMIRHTLPEEDALHHASTTSHGERIDIALVCYPWASNLDEFDPLIHEEGVNVVPIRERANLEDFRAILLPGSRNTAESLRHLRTSGLAAEISRAARRGIPIVGVCGGMQMIGTSIHDPLAIESGDIEGLGLLDVETTFAEEKVTRQVEVLCVDGALVRGYEIHHGRTIAGARARPHLENDLGWREENVVGVYVHGAFENTAYRQRFLESLGWRGATRDWRALFDAEIERVARALDATGFVDRVVSGTMRG